jgi:hypothetical protein
VEGGGGRSVLEEGQKGKSTKTDNNGIEVRKSVEFVRFELLTAFAEGLDPSGAELLPQTLLLVRVLREAEKGPSRCSGGCFVSSESVKRKRQLGKRGEKAEEGKEALRGRNVDEQEGLQ